MSNKSLGNSFELELAEELYIKGWWVHLMKQDSSGQPADLICAKNGRTYLIDCKVCSADKFPLNRIEENQHLAMRKFFNTGNPGGWFALKLSDDIYMISHKMLTMLADYHKDLKRDLIMEYGQTLNEWMGWASCE